MVTDTPDAVRPRGWLMIEFAALYFGAPLVIALFLPPRMMFSALFILTLTGLVLLWRTGGFQWRSLIRGWRRIRWLFLLIFTIGVGLLGWGIMSLTRPDDLWPFTADRLQLLALIWMLYPVLSALPQELIFRPLFFHRYKSILPRANAAIVANAAVFSFAHLMYWSWIVAAMTFAGGLVFAHAYLHRGFLSAWLLHAFAGNMLFAVGMGYYFWSGNVVRPF